MSAAVLAETLKAYPGCRCEEKKYMKALRPHVRKRLKPDMPVSDLREVCAGCTTRVGFNAEVLGVCRRLDAVRRRYGI